MESRSDTRYEDQQHDKRLCVCTVAYQVEELDPVRWTKVVGKSPLLVMTYAPWLGNIMDLIKVRTLARARHADRCS